MSEAERVLAEVAKCLNTPVVSEYMLNELRNKTAPYLPKPEPDRLTVAAERCVVAIATGRGAVWADQVSHVRAIIAREVAAAEPSDEVIERVFRLGFNASRNWNHDNIRAALKGEGA